MHPLISYDVAKLMLDDRLRAARERPAHEIRTPRRRSHPLRAGVGRGLIALGARLASSRRTDAPEQGATMIMIRLNQRP